MPCGAEAWRMAQASKKEGSQVGTGASPRDEDSTLAGAAHRQWPIASAWIRPSTIQEIDRGGLIIVKFGKRASWLCCSLARWLAANQIAKAAQTGRHTP